MPDFFAKLDQLYLQGDLQAVEEYLQQEASNAKVCCGRKSVMYSAIMNELAGLYRNQSRFDRALSCYEQSLLVSDLDTADYATILMGRANLYCQTKEYDKAEQDLKEAELIFAKTIDQGDFRYQTLRNTYSMLYLEQGQYELARQHLELAIQAIKNLADHERVLATSYVNLAQIYLRDHKIEKFKELESACEAVFENKELRQDASYAAYLSTKGSFYFEQGDFQKAAKSFEQALKLIESIYGQNLSAAQVLENLAQVYAQLDMAQSKQYWQKALDLYTQVLGVDHAKTKRIKDVLK